MPALGPDGAADVQRQMTEWTLSHARQLQQRWSLMAPDPCAAGMPSVPRSRDCLSLRVDVRFAGGETSLMEQWLGSDWSYSDQGGGDLGDRLVRAFQSAFDHGAKAAIAVGIDCPGVTADVLAQAYEQLQTHDGVIGPADDGGYYLIGLQRPTPELFKGIAWGTETVRASTLELAEASGLAIAQLSPLADVDRPEDLLVWQCVSGQTPLQKEGRISIVIPVLNEADHIQSTIESIHQAHIRQGKDTTAKGGSFEKDIAHDSEKDIAHDPDLEIIVVDGGSQDDTRNRAKAMGVRVISSSPGRALQMNAGAAIATGEYILFLHADTRLPNRFASHIPLLLAQPTVIAGAFELSIQGNQLGLRLIEWGVKWRSHIGQMPYGDQAIFLKTQTFRQLGGFPRLPIMEDFALIRRAKAQGQVAIARAAVTTSGRRWQRLGLLRTTCINQIMILGFMIGLPMETLAHWYRQKK